jgi:hypothetical protein
VALGMALGLGCSTTQHTQVQSAPAKATPIVEGDHIPSGTEFMVQLDQPINKDTDPGQRFSAHVVQDVVDANGMPLIPSGSLVMGQVAAVEKGSDKHPAKVVLTVQGLLVRGVVHPVDAGIVETTLNRKVTAPSNHEPELPAGAPLTVKIQRPIATASLLGHHTAMQKGQQQKEQQTR